MLDLQIHLVSVPPNSSLKWNLILLQLTSESNLDRTENQLKQSECGV